MTSPERRARSARWEARSAASWSTRSMTAAARTTTASTARTTRTPRRRPKPSRRRSAEERTRPLLEGDPLPGEEGVVAFTGLEALERRERRRPLDPATVPEARAIDLIAHPCRELAPEPLALGRLDRAFRRQPDGVGQQPRGGVAQHRLGGAVADEVVAGQREHVREQAVVEERRPQLATLRHAEAIA